METLILHPTMVSSWQSLVLEAKNHAKIPLTEELESYLVFMLMRFSENPNLVSSIIALEFLHTLSSTGRQQEASLREVGDKCLLFSGLFPGLARRRRVPIGYFVKMGQGAYSSLSCLSHFELGALFAHLCEQFVPIMDILHTVREMETHTPALDPLQAEELWSDTGSHYALQTLKNLTHPNALFIPPPSETHH